MDLDPRHKVFADAIIAGKSITDAAIEAKFSEKTAASQGSRLLKNVKVAHYIQQAKAEVTERVIETSIVTKEKVLASIDQILLLALADKKYSAALKAAELQGKAIGIWKDVTVTAQVTLEDLLAKSHETPEPKEEK